MQHRLKARAHVETRVDPAQVTVDGPSREPEDPPDLPGEVVFAPKELKIAQDLSERLGYATISGRTRSRPSGLSSGRRSLSESDHRRALMLPQELIQMPANRLIVLKAGAPPVRGRKIAYYREPALTRRIQAPPEIPPRALTSPPSKQAWLASIPPSDDPLSLDVVAATLANADLEPLPPQGAADAEIEGWVDRFLQTTAARDPEAGHVR